MVRADGSLYSDSFDCARNNSDDNLERYFVNYYPNNFQLIVNSINGKTKLSKDIIDIVEDVKKFTI